MICFGEHVSQVELAKGSAWAELAFQVWTAPPRWRRLTTGTSRNMKAEADRHQWRGTYETFEPALRGNQHKNV